eukprot:143687-Chlamydomonas_euryale.AAC.1
MHARRDGLVRRVEDGRKVGVGRYRGEDWCSEEGGRTLDKRKVEVGVGEKKRKEHGGGEGRPGAREVPSRAACMRALLVHT